MIKLRALLFWQRLPTLFGLLPAMALALLACPKLYAMDAQQRFVGRAYGDNGDLLYSEFHALRGECMQGQWLPQEHEVLYLKPDHELPFARKTLSYGNSLLRPEVDFHQSDWQETLWIRYQEDETVRIVWRRGETKERSFSVDPPSDLVFDAGFDHLVRQSWRQLQRGTVVEFRFLAPTRARSYQFQLKPLATDLAQGGLNVVIRPTGLLTRMLVAPIELSYNPRGFLTRFNGLTNIRQDEQVHYNADIHYDVLQQPDCRLIP
ncbi:hypothetical protein [Marinobacter sp. SS21]|uniref:hypothetical protein n=1 Tax=Marinobacter sp. SS21 TaxID=2979460 RepID=UPI00232B24F1|nr:hypothetical protein [Marinobacter sp. SS21]MDC0661819.1 hypothetical protein [Marinobacter sp. SS21]